MSTLIILVVSSIAIYLLYTLFSRLSQNHIPVAHFTSSLSSFWLHKLRRDGKTGIRAILTLHYPPAFPAVPIIRLSPREISVASVEGLRAVYTGGFEKDEFYSQFTNYEGTRNMVSTLGNKDHAVRKRMLSSIYTKSSIQSSTQVQELASNLVCTHLGPRLRSILVSRAEKESWGKLDAYTLNLAAGADFTSAFLLGVDSCTGFTRDFPAAKKFLKLWITKSRELPGHETATKEVESMVMKLVRKSRDSGAGSDSTVRAQLQSHLDINAQKSAELLDEGKASEERIVASEILDHLIAGVETARITLTYLQHELSLPHNALLQVSLRAELRSLHPALRLDSADDNQHLPTAKLLDALPLLDSILKETLRLYPPSPAPLPRIVPPEGTTLHGFFIPGGTTIGTSSHVLHQNPFVFDSPREFRPERWRVKPGDEAAEQKLKEMNRWFWPFGSGARMCIGNHFAIYMLKVIVASIYTSFETCIIDDEGIEQEDAFLAGPIGEKLVLGLRSVP